jgi:galactonate dehydratase
MNEIWAEIIGFPAMRMVNGKYPLPTKPGLGFEIKEETLAKYPFKGTGIFPPSFCPDGSLASQ